MGNYSNRTWACPFYTYDEKLCVHCEGSERKNSCISFPDKESLGEYAKAYCASADGWQRCTIAINLNKFYNRKEKRP